MVDGKLAIVEGLVLLFVIGMVLPALISAKSTTLVICGIMIILGVMGLVLDGLLNLDMLPYKSRIVNLIKKDML